MGLNIYSKEHKNIVEKLKRARLDSGMEQEEVARKMGRTQSYISKIESGQRKISILQLKELAKVYKKDINYFID